MDVSTALAYLFHTCALRNRCQSHPFRSLFSESDRAATKVIYVGCCNKPFLRCALSNSRQMGWLAGALDAVGRSSLHDLSLHTRILSLIYGPLSLLRSIRPSH